METRLLHNANSSSVHKFTKDQKTFLVLFGVISFMYNIIYSITAPLYPPEATLKGLSASEFGSLMALTCGSIAVSTFFLPRMEKFGLKFCLVLGIFLSGTGAMLMGVLHFLHSWMFMTVSAIAFIVGGFAGALYLSSTYILCMTVFPTRTAVAVGVIEGGVLAGASIGPLMSEIIYTYIGYTPTFSFYGLVQIANGFIVALALPEIPPFSGMFPTFVEIVRGYVDISKFPSVILFATSLMALQLSMDFLSPILEPALRPYNLTRIGVGLTFFSLGAPQLLGMFWGILLDKLKRPEICLMGSSFMIAIAALILSLTINTSYAGLVLGLLLYGLGLGMMDVSSMFNFQLEVKEKRRDHSATINFSFIGVVYAFMTGAGGLLAPVISGSLYDLCGFSNTLLFIVATHSTLGVLIILYSVHNKCRVRSILLFGSADYEEIE